MLAMVGIYGIIIIVTGIVDFIIIITLNVIQIGINKKRIQLFEPLTYCLTIY